MSKSFDKETFLRVWGRVLPSEGWESESCGCGDDEAERLRGFITARRQSAAVYRTLLSRGGSSRAAQVLRRLLQEAQAQEKRLQREYFLLTGDTFSPRVRVQHEAGFLSGLRRCYGEEQRACDEYRKGAERTENKELSALYRTFAANCERRRDRLRTLIDGMMR